MPHGQILDSVKFAKCSPADIKRALPLSLRFAADHRSTLSDRLNTSWEKNVQQYDRDHLFSRQQQCPECGLARSDNDIRHKFDLLGTLDAGHWFHLGTGLSLYSGKPVNITTGDDENRDGLSLDRPAGTPRNSLHGPAYIGLDLSLGRDFALALSGTKGPVLSLSLNSFNVLNHGNDTTYIGVASSPFFGHAVAAQPSRRLQLNCELKF